MHRNFLIVDPADGTDVLKAICAPTRVAILTLLHDAGALNVNDIAERLGQPQSSISAHIRVLEEAGLIRTRTERAIKGNQKLCEAVFDEVLIRFRKDPKPDARDMTEVAMPLGLYTRCEVSAPCGLCSPTGIIGFLDVPDTFLDPGRMTAGLIWFIRGFVEYQFPNKIRLMQGNIASVEFSMELSSEVPGTAADWPSDISFAVNGVAVGIWTSPGSCGDRRGAFTPDWWTLKGRQYGMRKALSVTPEGSFVDGVQISPVTLRDVGIEAHRSIRLRIGVEKEAHHPGGVNIFGKGFGNYDQDIVMRLATTR